MFVGKRGGLFSKMFPAAFLAVVCIFGSLTSAQEETPDVTEVNGIRRLIKNYFYITNSIYETRSQKEGNILFSPLSIQLVDVYCMSNEETVPVEINRPGDRKAVEAEFRDLIASLENDSSNSFHIAYSCNGTDTNTHNDDEELTHTSLVSVEHTFNSNNSSETTDDSPPKANSTADSVLALENSFNFTSEWLTKFDKSHTKSEQFFETPTQTKEVQMMHLTSDKVHLTDSEELDCKVLELPYKGDKISLLVVLPNAVGGLANLETKILSLNLTQLLNRTHERVVTVALPKFNIEHSRITAAHLTKAVEKANFGANEDGTIGAAADNEEVDIVIQSTAPEVFVADHPFLFALLERHTQILFLFGRVSSP